MAVYIVRRLLHSVVVLLGASLLVFGIVRLTGDPVSLMVPMDASPEAIQALRNKLGLDAPLYIQYFRFLGDIARGDFGTSLRHQQPALTLVLQRMPATLQLTVAGLAFAMIVGVPLGILSALRDGTLVDLVGTVLALLGQAIPGFWLGLLLILLFGVRWHLLPTFGGGSFSHLIMPAITVGSYTTAIIVRLLRSAMLEVLNEDYLRTARAKGLLERTVIARHALRNALIPVVTVLGLQFAALIGGAVVTETIFAWPGVGRLAVQSIYNRDYPVVQAIVLVVVATFIIVNLMVDLIYGWLDPRIRYD